MGRSSESGDSQQHGKMVDSYLPIGGTSTEYAVWNPYCTVACHFSLLHLRYTHVNAPAEAAGMTGDGGRLHGSVV
jgi:hypothetical protein